MIVLVTALGVAGSGDRQAKVMTEVQPMKMAAAEAQYETKDNAGFSVFTIGTLEGGEEVFSLRIPGLLSFLGKGSFSAPIEGVNDLQTVYEAKYGPGDYTPNVPLVYWSFRLMMGVGMSSPIGRSGCCGRSARGCPPRGVGARGDRAAAHPAARQLLRLDLHRDGPTAPWIVFGLMPTAAGVSPVVEATEVLISLIGFTLLYGFLAVVEVRLLIAPRAGLPGPPPAAADEERSDDPRRHRIRRAAAPLAFAD